MMAFTAILKWLLVVYHVFVYRMVSQWCPPDIKSFAEQPTATWVARTSNEIQHKNDS